jgi:hypothetical protein
VCGRGGAWCLDTSSTRASPCVAPAHPPIRCSIASRAADAVETQAAIRTKVAMEVPVGVRPLPRICRLMELVFVTALRITSPRSVVPWTHAPTHTQPTSPPTASPLCCSCSGLRDARARVFPLAFGVASSAPSSPPCRVAAPPTPSLGGLARACSKSVTNSRAHSAWCGHSHDLLRIRRSCPEPRRFSRTRLPLPPARDAPAPQRAHRGVQPHAVPGAARLGFSSPFPYFRAISTVKVGSRRRPSVADPPLSFRLLESCLL